MVGVLYGDQPDLMRAPESPPPGRPVKVQQCREVWVPFMDGTRVIEWRRDKLGWWCLLGWGVSGELMGEWCRYDPVRMEPLGEDGGPPTWRMRFLRGNAGSGRSCAVVRRLQRIR